MHTVRSFSALLFFLLIAGSNLYPMSDVRISDTRVPFRHFETVLNPNGTLQEFHTNKIVTDHFWAKVIENDFIRVTLVPEYGARMISIIYKPTGKELLYRNPVGTVFGWKENTFYYDYLMVWGGIFPTFPEPEHGKTWQSPWAGRVTVQTPEQITVEMQFTDNLKSSPNTPFRFRHSKTGITSIVTVTVRKTSSAVEWNVTLTNTRKFEEQYEYWTCMTLAPGSEPDKTAATGNTEIVIPTHLIKMMNNWWNWMTDGNKGKHTENDIATYNCLSTFSNWQDQGIAYVYPYVTNNWYGVLNRENNMGIFRVTKRTNETPGLKIWTWGYEQSIHADPNNPLDQKRPYIELWAGNSTEFFIPAVLDPFQKKQWSEFYIPTVGLSNISFANENAALLLYPIKSVDKKNMEFRADIFTMFPGSTINAEMQLNNNKKKTRTILVTNFVSDPTNCNSVTAAIPTASIGKGKYELHLILKNTNGELLARTSVPFINE